MFKHFYKFLAIFAVLFIFLLIIPASFAHENQTDAAPFEDTLNEGITNIYFDVSVSEDGDGSKENPYKTIELSKLKNDSNIYFEEGDYIFESEEFSLSNVNFYGKDPEKTCIYAHNLEWDTLNIDTKGLISISNLTFSSTRFNVSDEFTAENSIFVLNFGYKYRQGAAINTNDETFTTVNINKCQFKNYFACFGAAIISDNGILNIFDSEFSGNMAFPYEYVLAEGGAILIHNSTARIKNSNFRDNSADSSAGAIYTILSNTTIDDCTFEENSAQLGSAVASEYGNLIVENTLFKNNRAGYGAIKGNVANITVINSTFENNQAKYGGAAICVENTNLSVSSSKFKNNSAKSSGGSINTFNSQNIKLTDSTFEDDFSNRIGASLFLEKSSIEITQSNFTNGNAIFGGAIGGLNSDITLNSGLIRNCSAKFYGGAMYNYDGQMSISDSNLQMNNADLGGALYLNYGNLNIGSTTLEDNKAVNGSAGYLNQANFTDLGNVYLKNNDFHKSDSFELFIGNGNYTMMVVNDTISNDLPKKYDSREHGYVTPVSNQLNGDYCWAFSTIAVLESCIAKATGMKFDLSENNLINLNKKYSPYGLNKTAQAGNPINAIGYLLSWLGPVNDSDDTYDAFSTISPVLNSLMHVQNVLFLDMKYDDSDRDAIKQAIMKYGAVGTSVYWMQFYPLQNGSSYYHYSDEPALSNHAITLVGWDDNYSKDNFGLTPPGDGAWICKNTWGTGTGDNGYFYISYYTNSLNYEFFNYSSEYMNLDRVFTFILNDTIHLDKNYQYDFAGPTTEYSLYNATSIKNVFTASEDEYLAAVSTYFLQNTEYEVFIYVNGQLVHKQSSTSRPGYYTIYLDKIIPLKANDKFEIAFNMTNMDGYMFSVYGIEKNDVAYDIFNESRSYISYPWQEGDWFDVGSFIFCIKAFTILSELDTSLTLDVGDNEYNPIDITARVTDEYGRAVNAGSVTFTVDGRNYTVDVSDGLARFTHSFEKGKNDLTATFNGQGYRQSQSFVRINVTKNRVDFDVDVSIYQYSAIFNISTSQSINEQVQLTVDGKPYFITLIDGKFKIQINDLANSEHKFSVEIINSDSYGGKANGTFVVDVKQPKILADDFETFENSKEAYSIKLVDKTGNALSGKTVKFNINGNDTESVTDGEGVASIVIDLAGGKYEMTVTFEGDGEYKEISNKSSIKVKNLVSADVNVVKNYRDVDLQISLSKAISKELILTVNGNNQSIYTLNGKVTQKLYNLDDGEYSVSLYLNDNDYIFSSNKTTFNINVIEYKLIAKDFKTIENSGDKYAVELVDKDGRPVPGKTVRFNIDGKDYENVTDSEGVASLVIDLPGGIYAVNSSFGGDGTYMPSNSTNVIKVRGIVTSKINVVKSSNSAEISVILSRDIDVDLILSINGKNQILNSKETLKLNDLQEGYYNIAVYLDNDDYEFVSNSTSFHVGVLQTELVADDFTTYYGSGTNYTVRLIDENGKPVEGKSIRYKLDGKQYSVIANERGIILVPIDLSAGTYRFEANFDGFDEYQPSDLVTNIIVKTSIVLPSANVYTYNAPYMIKAYNVNGMELSVNDFILEADGEVKQLALGEKGSVVYSIDLDAGEHSVKVINTKTGEVKTQKITVKPLLSENKDITMYYGAGSVYKVKVLDENGNAAVSTPVTIKIGSSSKTVTTDSNGYAKLQITSKPGKYTITAVYKGFKVSNKLTVKTTLVTKNVAVKKGKAIKFTAKLLSSKGKILKSKMVTFKFSGKTYKIKTNSKGIATLKVTKNLKVGSYTIKTTYGKLTVSNKVTIKK